MRRANQVLLQLREADRYACAKNPFLRRLSVVLLDNVVELQLTRWADFALLRDRTTWYSGVRKHGKRVRREVFRNHRELVEFARAEGWITEEDVHLLRFAHRVRNAFYHEGGSDALDAEIAIQLLYRFIKARFPEWSATPMLVEISPYEPIPIAEAEGDSTGFRPLLLKEGEEPNEAFYHSHEIQTKDYWDRALNAVLTHSSDQDLRELICNKVAELLDDIESRIAFITEDDINFCDVLISRFAIMTPAFTEIWASGRKIAADGAFNVYLAALKHEERLLDIADPGERAKEFHQLIKTHSIISNPLSTERIDEYREQAENLLSIPEAEGVAFFLRVDEDLEDFGNTLREMSFDLDMYISRRIDEMRGK